MAFGVALNAGCRKEPPPPPRIAAAADLSVAFEEIGRIHEQKTGQKVDFIFGSTGLLAKQIQQGAPFDLFAAANVSFTELVVAAGACDGSTRQPYARGRVVVWSKKGHIEPPRTLEDLANPRFSRLAIANPQHAPYGQAARDALRAAGVWEKIEHRMVYGENVLQTLQFAGTGNADVALVALALVALDRENPWFLVEEQLHPPIDQALVACDRGRNKEGALAFARTLASEEGRAVMKRRGFLLPGEAISGAP